MNKGPSCLVVLSEGHDLSFLWSGRLDLKLVRTGNKVLSPMLGGKSAVWQEYLEVWREGDFFGGL